MEQEFVCVFFSPLLWRLGTPAAHPRPDKSKPALSTPEPPQPPHTQGPQPRPPRCTTTQGGPRVHQGYTRGRAKGRASKSQTTPTHLGQSGTRGGGAEPGALQQGGAQGDGLRGGCLGVYPGCARELPLALALALRGEGSHARERVGNAFCWKGRKL